ncbi:PIR Superfamily Protein [Plasmodium ovale wallikeri]|uniref:PIR Superfamily Protein n=1 Tax=Plasmodium ovale wallikeri TaxID=864142 RepID=A0A1A9AIM3_PLAOA|nr:PIR Superfamily Protein [Plasmodium ovale wallikeri]
MTKNNFLDELPSRKYKKELERGIHYQDVDQNISGDILKTYVEFWGNTWPPYLGNYINDYMNDWSNSNFEKRCRDLNHILDFILKRIKRKIPDSQGPYELIKEYINKAAETHLSSWGNDCKRNSKLNTHYDDIENLKKIDDFCEDIAYLEKNISEIHSNDCKQIEIYIDQQITDLKPIYTNSQTKYLPTLEYYNFKSFEDFNSKITNLKSKYQEGIDGAHLAGDKIETSQYSGGNTSIIAVTSLSGILSSALLLYKTTPFGSILNNVIQKRLKFGNNLNEEIDYETLEAIPESSHNGSYNILYNTVGTS